MDVRGLKNYIYESRRAGEVLEAIGCHHVRYHASGGYWTCANADGDNKGAVVVYDEERLPCVNYTRQMVRRGGGTDIIDLVCYTMDMTFPKGLSFLCDALGLPYYHDFSEDVPESFRVLRLIDDMRAGRPAEEDPPLRPISESVLSYYKPYVNSLFLEDGIGYATQRAFEVGYDEESRRLTIPIRSEAGDLVGVKGRYFGREVPDGECKYVYLEPCAKSRVLYGLHKTAGYIKEAGRVYVLEAEKSVMQLWEIGCRNCVATGGKGLSQCQADMLARLGADIILCFDKDVGRDEIGAAAKLFPEGMPVLYMFDEEGLLSGHESPSDSPGKWRRLASGGIRRIA